MIKVITQLRSRDWIEDKRENRGVVQSSSRTKIQVNTEGKRGKTLLLGLIPSNIFIEGNYD